MLPLAARAVTVEEEWRRPFNGPSNHQDTGYAVAVGRDGGVFFAGTSYSVGVASHQPFVRKCSPAGTEQWTVVLPDQMWSNGRVALAVDSGGDAILAGLSHHEGSWQLTTWKLDGQFGTVRWARHNDAAGLCFTSAAVDTPLALGADDTIHVLGCGLITVKYAPDGTELWQRSLRPSPAIDCPMDIAVDAAGRVYVVGADLAGSAGFGLVVYDAVGDFQWDGTQVGTIGNSFGPAWVDLDAASNVVVAAVPESMCGLFSLMLWKYDSAGQFLWRVDYPDNPCDSFTACGMRVAPGGAVYTAAALGGSADIALVKFGPDGGFAWQRTYDGPAGSTDIPFDLVCDAAENTYIVGEEYVSTQNFDIVTLSYDAAGNERWTTSFSGAVNTNDRAHGVALDGCGRVYVAGYFWNPPNNYDAALIRYTQVYPGDLDTDGDIDVADFAVLQQNYGLTPAQPQDGDLDLDGDVDQADAAAMYAALGGPCS